MNMLVQESQTQTSRTNHIASIGSLVTADKSKDRSFARAVSSYQADVLACVYLQRSAAQDILHAVRLMNLRKTKQHLSDSHRSRETAILSECGANSASHTRFGLN